MSLLEVLSGIITISCGVVLGTLLTWIISYYICKRVLPKLLNSLSSNPEIIKAIQALRMNSNCEQARMEIPNDKTFQRNIPYLAQIDVDIKKCNGCFKCVEICPFGIFEIKEKKISVAHPEKCHLCLACEAECPVHAVKITEHPLVTGEIHG